MTSTEKTKQANRRFFDIAADVYEKVDVRRGKKVSRWLDESIDELKRKTNGTAILDVGCGTGFVMNKSEGKFDLIVGVDISPNMLKEVKSGYVVCADADNLPFKDDVFDVTTSIAVLHHVLNHKPMFNEIYRILNAGGIFYSDHDIDDGFVRKFGWLVKIRRRFCDNSIRYFKAKKELNKELYEQSEVHHDGIDSRRMKTQLIDLGFSNVDVKYHWLGLNTILNAIVSIPFLKYMPYGYAPNASFWAKK